MTRSRLVSLIIVSASILFVASLPAVAQGDPQLDPNNGSGTAYDFVVQGSRKPLDPSAGRGATGKLNGTLTIFQTSGAPDFTADVLIDTDRDGNQTGALTCDGSVGSGRVGISCSGLDEHGDDFFIMVLTKAVTRQGKIVLQAGRGLGFSIESSLTFVFHGQQQ